MMLPVSRFKGHPLSLGTTAMPWLSVSSDPAPHWMWLASWSAATYQATPPFIIYPPTVWIPEQTHLIQWEHPGVEVVPLLPRFCHSALVHPPTLTKLAEGWIPAEEVTLFQRRDKHVLLTNQIIQGPGGHAPRFHLLLPSHHSGRVRRNLKKTPEKDCSSSSRSSSSSSCSFSSSCSSSLLSAPAPSGGAYCKWAGLNLKLHKGAWPFDLSNQDYQGAGLPPVMRLERRLSPPPKGPVSPSQISIERWPVSPLHVMKNFRHFFSPRNSRLTLLTNYSRKKPAVNKVSHGHSFLLQTEGRKHDEQCVSVHRGEEEEERSDKEGKNKRPVASTPVPGSPWCVVWTGDDRVFFFNPTMHLSVWERPGELIGRDISRIIQDPPHKRKRTTPAYSSADEHHSKRNRTETSMSVPRPEDVKLIPLELRESHFREMMLERGVSAFSSWEKQLHKMVFDSRYLLLTSEQRKQVFEQFVKSRVKDEYKEKKNKEQKSREEFKHLLEDAKITSRSTFKEFCACYHGDQRFIALHRKKEQEILFQHYITSLKKRDKENRLRKMR